MSTNSDNPLMGEQPKKYHLWGLWVPLLVLLSIVLLPVGLVALLFYDPSHIDTGITEKKDDSTVFTNMMTDMFDGCRFSDDPSIDLIITQKQLNQILYNASSSFVADPNSVLKQFSVTITDKEYVFDLEISAFKIAKTHLSLKTEIEVGATIGESKGFLFRIVDLKVGRLGNLEGVLPWLSQTAGLDLSTILREAGLSIDLNIDELKLTYTYDDFVNDMSQKSGTTDPLFLNIFANFFKQDYISFVHHKDTDVTGTIHLSQFMTNPLYSNSDYFIQPLMGENSDIPLLTYSSNIAETLINNGTIQKDESINDHTLSVIKFLSYGKEFLNEQELAYVTSIYDSFKENYCDNKDLDTYSNDMKDFVFGSTHAGIMDRVTSTISARLNGMSDEEKNDFLDRVESEGSYYLYGPDNPLVVEDTEIHTMLKANPNLIGYGFSFISQRDDGSSKSAYTILDNIYPTIIGAKDDDPAMMALTFGLNINGAETSLIMPTKAQEVHIGGRHGLSFDMGNADLYFGTAVFPDLKGQLQNIINNIESEEGSMIQYLKDPVTGDTTKIQLIFDFDNYFSNNPDTPFTIFNNAAESRDTKLFVDFDIKSTSGDMEGKRKGQIDVRVGYAKNLA